MQKDYGLCYRFDSDLFVISCDNRSVHCSEIDNFYLRNGLESGNVASVVCDVATEMYNEAFHITATH
jgi:hypothetical protein